MICKSFLGRPFVKRLFGALAVVGGVASPLAAEGLYVGGDLGVALPGSLESTRTNIGIPTNCDQWLGSATLLDGTRVPLPASECQPRTLPAAANEFDLESGFAAGLNAGFRHGRLRFEAEYLHRRQEGEVLPLVVAGDSKQREFVRRDEGIGDVTGHGLFANVYWDLGRSPSNERLRPFLGAGLGAARVGIDYAATSIRNSDPQALLALGRNPHAAGTVSRADESLAEYRTSLVVDPPDGRIPALRPEAEARRAAARLMRGRPAEGPEDRGLSERCLMGFNSGPPMTPSVYNNNVQFFLTPDHFGVLNEMVHNVRLAPLDGRPHLPASLRQWAGDARASWDGDTLVVETRNFLRETSFAGSSAGLHLVERFTRTGPDTLTYAFTVTDPATWVRPWTAEVRMTRSDEPLYEYACHEGNYSMASSLTGTHAVRAAEAGGGQ